MKVNSPLWKNRPILEEHHAQDLEAKAALHQFESKMSAEDAENKAYKEYKDEHHRIGAAKHFAGMKAARATGDSEEAKKHSTMFKLHMTALGHDPYAPLPMDVEAKSTGQIEPHYRFTPHKADVLLLKADPANDNKTKAEQVFDDAFSTMAEDPGFQELRTKAQEQAKQDRLKAGFRKFRPGMTVHHVDRNSYPWDGKVMSHQYREHDIDGPGHYYEVKWWNPKIKQFHEDYLHQDNLTHPGMVKAWPKDEAENEENANAHNVLWDLHHELGGTSKEIPPAKSRLDLEDKNKDIRFSLGAVSAQDSNNEAYGAKGDDLPFPRVLEPHFLLRPEHTIRTGRMGFYDSRSPYLGEFEDKDYWDHHGLGKSVPGVDDRTLKSMIDDLGEQKALQKAWASYGRLNKSELHSDVGNFMMGLKALPKGSPERGLFITKHVNHGPFIAALQAHPQGKQIHQMLTGFLNSKANAGPSNPKVTVK